MEYKMNDTLINCINEVANLTNADKVNIKGKFYTTVDTRVDIFRKHFGCKAEIVSDIIMNDLERVVVKASITIKNDGEWKLIGSGYAEEFRGQGMVNKTSALENCETSAVGRALAACGLGGGAYASSFEVDNAINNKSEAPNLDDGYVLRRPTGSILQHCVDEKIFLKHLRTFLGDPTNQEHRELYEVNVDEIKKASDHATVKKDQDAYKKLIGLYEEHIEAEEEISQEIILNEQSE